MGAGLSTVNEPAAAGAITVDLKLSVSIPVEEVVALAEAAGRAILEIYNSEVSKWEVELKSDSSPLTKADRVANQVICQGLQGISPHIPIVSEENRLQAYAVRKKYEYFWLVDPVDGTKEFLKRNGEFTVNIALVYRNEPIMGVVHVPCTGKTYWAVKDKGSWVRQGPPTQRTQQRITASPFSLSDKGLSIVGSSSHPSKETAEFMQLFDSPEIMHIGSSLKLLMVAEGSAHIYPRMVPCMEWDTAAADVIVREAGGVVLYAGLCDDTGKPLEDWKTELLKEKPLTYNKENLLNPFFVVFGKRSDKPDGR